MKSLVAIFTLVGALAFWGGTDVAKAVVKLSCDTTKCTFNEEIGKSQIKYFQGRCDGSGTEMTQDNSSMICHKQDHLTCTSAAWNLKNDEGFWACSCDNSSPSKRANTTIDLECPPPS